MKTIPQMYEADLDRANDRLCDEAEGADNEWGDSTAQEAAAHLCRLGWDLNLPGTFSYERTGSIETISLVMDGAEIVCYNSELDPLERSPLEHVLRAIQRHYGGLSIIVAGLAQQVNGTTIDKR